MICGKGLIENVHYQKSHLVAVVRTSVMDMLCRKALIKYFHNQQAIWWQWQELVLWVCSVGEKNVLIDEFLN